MAIAVEISGDDARLRRFRHCIAGREGEAAVPVPAQQVDERAGEVGWPLDWMEIGKGHVERAILVEVADRQILPKV